ncbi:hypothetical protein M422DRAFT_248124 [Sphaerobolus stellatus SS14]|uniref:Cytochrome P450 n=1 Tax=Sphaerobolus stellatus (strain SS14) TaxID=990650 RepID=A0A0C9UWC4_SPHS4|nr:hypothetical protein M422DRAFT_248124 [Sphaerobolus stellatus SS14]
MKDVNALVEVIIRDVVIKYDREDVKEGESLLGHLITVTDDTKVIANQTLNILLAGRGTTASLITFTTFCLAMHPEIVQRLRQEISDTLGFDKAPT